MKPKRVEQIREDAGIPKSGPDPIQCYGVCNGVSGWKDPDIGLHCSLCHGSGQLSYG